MRTRIMIMIISKIYEKLDKYFGVVVAVPWVVMFLLLVWWAFCEFLANGEALSWQACGSLVTFVN